jgi:hypothetical protein
MSNVPEHAIAAEISRYLTARADRIASDVGIIVMRDDGGTLIAMVDGTVYEVAIIVTRR